MANGCLTSVSNDCYVIGLSMHTCVKCAILNSVIHFKNAFLENTNNIQKQIGHFKMVLIFHTPAFYQEEKLLPLKQCQLYVILQQCGFKVYL